MDAISAMDFLDDKDDERPGSFDSFSGSEEDIVKYSKTIQRSMSRYIASLEALLNMLLRFYNDLSICEKCQDCVINIHHGNGNNGQCLVTPGLRCFYLRETSRKQ